MCVDDTRVAIDKTGLVDIEVMSVVLFKQTVESIKYGWIAQIGIFEHDPVTSLDGIDNGTVPPHKVATECIDGLSAVVLFSCLLWCDVAIDQLMDNCLFVML